MDCYRLIDTGQEWYPESPTPWQARLPDHQLTRMRVLCLAAEPFLARSVRRKSRDQRMPSGGATPRFLSLQNKIL